MSMFQRAYTQPRPALQTREYEGVEGQDIAGVQIPGRTVGKRGKVTVTQDRAMRHSAVWACCRIRADLISTFPLDVFRKFNGIQIEMPKPPVMVLPGGVQWDFIDWMWASQRDLDTSGNVIGLIRERNGAKNRFYPEGLPSLIELQDTRACSIVRVKGQTKYRIDGRLYDPPDVYHERQYPMSGTPVGLSPIVQAADTIGESLSMQQYGLDWFSGGAIPKAWMRNTRKRLEGPARDAAKEWYRETIDDGDVMVTGNDWEYNMIQSEQAGMEWLEGRRFGVTEICRFFGVPADLVDGAIPGQSITYANITQRNLQFLIMSLGPAVIRRERSLSRLLPEPRFVKLNTDALLRMDAMQRQQVIRSRIETWQLTNEEGRALDNLPPLNPAQIDQMQTIYGSSLAGRPAAATPAAGGGTSDDGADEQQPDQVPADTAA